MLFQGCESDISKNATCTHKGPFRQTCVCNTGYQGDGFSCTAINACLTNNGGCGPNATCTNTGPGTRTCTCNTGYSSGRIPCTAINACLTNNGGCSAHATCTNTGPDTRTCACNSGYSGDGFTCMPNDYQLTVTAGSGGIITVPPSSPITVTYGVATSISATPDTQNHYGFFNWTETTNTGVTFGDVNSATTTVTLTGTGGDAIIQANFIQFQIITVAGNGTSDYSGDNGPAMSAGLPWPCAVAVDSSDNLYIADSLHNRIRKVDTSGIITTLAGNGTYGYSGDNGPATSAELYYPYGVEVDSSGNLYIADGNNQRIRKVDTSGIITTVAGNGYIGYSGDNGPATSAELNLPSDVAIDSLGSLYIADAFNFRIRKVY